MNAAPDVVVQLGDGYLLVGPATVGYVVSALERVERQHRLEGITPPPAWRHLRDAAVKARNVAFKTADCVGESTKARNAGPMARSAQIGSGRLVGAGRVAEVLGCSDQWSRARLRRGDFATARRVGRSWLVEEDEVVALALVEAAQTEVVA